MTDTGRSPDGSGSRASHEAASASSPKASIPNADQRYFYPCGHDRTPFNTRSSATRSDRCRTCDIQKKREARSKPRLVIPIKIAPLGDSGMMKLTAPSMPTFSVLGKSVDELLYEAPICLAAVFNELQAAPKVDAQPLATKGETNHG